MVKSDAYSREGLLYLFSFSFGSRFKTTSYIFSQYEVSSTGTAAHDLTLLNAINQLLLVIEKNLRLIKSPYLTRKSHVIRESRFAECLYSCIKIFIINLSQKFFSFFVSIWNNKKLLSFFDSRNNILLTLIVAGTTRSEQSADIQHLECYQGDVTFVSEQ